MRNKKKKVLLKLDWTNHAQQSQDIIYRSFAKFNTNGHYVRLFHFIEFWVSATANV